MALKEPVSDECHFLSWNELIQVVAIVYRFLDTLHSKQHRPITLADMENGIARLNCQPQSNSLSAELHILRKKQNYQTKMNFQTFH